MPIASKKSEQGMEYNLTGEAAVGANIGLALNLIDRVAATQRNHLGIVLTKLDAKVVDEALRGYIAAASTLSLDTLAKAEVAA